MLIVTCALFVKPSVFPLSILGNLSCFQIAGFVSRSQLLVRIVRNFEKALGMIMDISLHNLVKVLILTIQFQLQTQLRIRLLFDKLIKQRRSVVAQILKSGILPTYDFIYESGLISSERNAEIGNFLFREKKRKRFWMKVRSGDWWTRIVNMNFDDDDWVENFRMSKEGFDQFCDRVCDGMKPSEHYVREPVPVRKRIGIAVFKLASCCEFRVVANLFGVHKATVIKIFRMFCLLISREMLSEFISFPNEDEAIQISKEYELQYAIPQVYGAIDGTHIPIIPPEEGHRDFINRKQYASYVLQAVVDNKLRIRNISCKVPGSAHDAQVLKESEIYKKSHLLPKTTRLINGVYVPLMILGDPAYPLLPWLMKAFKNDAFLTKEQESFNVYMSSARMTVETTFGRLKGRWRMVMKRMDIHFSLAPDVIATCCALHNFVEGLKTDTFQPRWLDEIEEIKKKMYPQPKSRETNFEDADAITARLALKDYLATNFPLRESSQFAC